MAAFRFPLQKVLELKEQREKQSAADLARARKEADEARRARADLESLRDAGRARLVQAHGAGGAVGHLQNLAYVVGQVDRQIRDAEEQCRKADEDLVEQVRAFHKAALERRTIGQLRERRLDQWRTHQARDERKTMDEVALSRHGRGDGTYASGGE